MRFTRNGAIIEKESRWSRLALPLSACLLWTFGEMTIEITKEDILLITLVSLYEKYLDQPQIAGDHQLPPRASVHDPRMGKPAKFP